MVTNKCLLKWWTWPSTQSSVCSSTRKPTVSREKSLDASYWAHEGRWTCEWTGSGSLSAGAEFWSSLNLAWSILQSHYIILYVTFTNLYFFFFFSFINRSHMCWSCNYKMKPNKVLYNGYLKCKQWIVVLNCKFRMFSQKTSFILMNDIMKNIQNNEHNIYIYIYRLCQSTENVCSLLAVGL